MSKLTVDKRGNKFWHNDAGILHREAGPAVEADGTKIWYLNGLFHREDGPAIEYENGDSHWYLNGLCHRENGPAIDDCLKHYYLFGMLIPEKKYLSATMDKLILEIQLTKIIET